MKDLKFVGLPANASPTLRAAWNAKWAEERLQYLSAVERCHVIWAEIEGRAPRAGSGQ